ncbi:Protein CBG01609 [Caenorhabditis briggsae]|uniref:Protein CBG01609 n=1 Tax=Caenorhabditis briggsae TaxID=6238 RepID=A8WR92_CAEBR|nr:Protein CBG01609 [Caenorhabditis briggsae]CAP23000.2 Protein CBG01609 [Caenorhabditis briggsae]
MMLFFCYHMIEINDTCAEDPPQADAFRMILIVFIGTIVCTIGIVLNSFLLLSFRRLDVFRSNLLYLFLLACLDILVELCFMLIFPASLVWDYFRVEFLYTCWHIYIKYVSTVGQVLIAASTLLIVAASFERYICSQRSSIQFSPQRRFLFISIVFTCALFMKGSVFFELELQSLPHCPPFQNLRLDLSEITRSESYKTIWMFWCRSIFNVFLPFFLLLVLNSLTISNLNKLHNNGFQSILVENRCQSDATDAFKPSPSPESLSCRPLLEPSVTSSTISSVSSSASNDQMPTLLRRNSEACAARRRKRDATRTLAALITIYLLTNTLNLLITIMEFINPDVLGSLGEGWTYKYLADLSSVLTISSTAFRLPVYFHCNRDIRTQIRDFARSCFIDQNEKKKLGKLTMPITSSSTESVL